MTTWQTPAPQSLYVHIPFCVHKCFYCDFNSYAGMEGLKGEYAEALCRELGWWGRQARLELDTVFFGGGTPSEMPLGELERVVAALHDAFDLAASAEVTLEANPGTVDEAYLAGLRRLGVNRLSIGVQSFDDGELRFLERIHSAGEAEAAYRAARAAGFDNVNLDLIFGLPGQTLAAWRASLERALLLAPEHLSLYALTVEPNTGLAHQVAAGAVTPLDGDAVAEMYELNVELTAKAGYAQYEISNVARPGRECRHNLTYWRLEPYIGAGCGAHGFVAGSRYANVASPVGYVRALAQGTHAGRPPWVASCEEQSSERLTSDWAIMGLRLNEGVSTRAFEERFGTSLVEAFPGLRRFRELGLVEEDGGCLRLTAKGRLLASEVAVELLEPRAGPFEPA